MEVSLELPAWGDHLMTDDVTVSGVRGDWFISLPSLMASSSSSSPSSSIPLSSFLPSSLSNATAFPVHASCCTYRLHVPSTTSSALHKKVALIVPWRAQPEPLNCAPIKPKRVRNGISLEEYVREVQRDGLDEEGEDDGEEEEEEEEERQEDEEEEEEERGEEAEGEAGGYEVQRSETASSSEPGASETEEGSQEKCFTSTFYKAFTHLYSFSPSATILATSGITSASASSTATAAQSWKGVLSSALKQHQELSLRHFRAIHPNLPPLDALHVTPQALVCTTKLLPRPLSSLIRLMRQADRMDHFLSAEMRIFLLYQLVHAVAFLHKQGLSHGHIDPSHIYVTGSHWLYLDVLPVITPNFAQPFSPLENNAHSEFYSEPSISTSLSSPAWTASTESAMFRWVKGELSNFDYLMELNRLAGREIGGSDVADHPILPWVSDFTSQHSSSALRDLTRSKFRLKKGDDQLDFTYLHSPSEEPHHVTELFSDITYYVYLSRISELDILKRIVRDRFVAAEYPPSMARIFLWTPDEAIPEFYTNPGIFASRHKDLGLDDLMLPSWTPTPESFITWHRSMLESDAVSANLHHWIDITFGYKLSGQAAIDAKNVPLRGVSKSARRSAFVQLFSRPHPERIVKSISTAAVRRSCESVGLSTTLSDTEVDSGAQTKNIPLQYPDDENETSVEGVNVTEKALTTMDEQTALMSDSIYELRLLRNAANFDDDYQSLEGIYEDFDLYARETSPHIVDQIWSVDLTSPNLSDSPPCLSTEPLSPTTKLLNDFADAPSFMTLSPSFDSLSQERQQAHDIFSLGCIAAELFLGKPLFTRSSWLLARDDPDPTLSSSLLVKLPPNLRMAIQSMIQPHWLHRPSVTELLKSDLFCSNIDVCTSNGESWTAQGRRSLQLPRTLNKVYHFVAQLRELQAGCNQPSVAQVVTQYDHSVIDRDCTLGPSALHINTQSSYLHPTTHLVPYIQTIPSQSPMLGFLSSDDIRTPPVKPATLLSDLAVHTPTDLSPLHLEAEHNESDEHKFADSVNASPDQNEPDAPPFLSSRSPFLPLSPVEQRVLLWSKQRLQCMRGLTSHTSCLLVPHILALASFPTMRLPSLSLISFMAKMLGRHLASCLLLPTLTNWFSVSDDIDLQIALVSWSTLDEVFLLYSYELGGREFVAHARNALLSSSQRIRETASRSLSSFLLRTLDLNREEEQEVAVRDIWAPMFARLGRSGSDMIVIVLSKIFPELDVELLDRFMLPMIKMLIEKGNGINSAEENPCPKSDTLIKLSCGLDLLIHLVPHLSVYACQTLLEFGLLHTMMSTAATADGVPLSFQQLKRLSKCWLTLLVILVSQKDETTKNSAATAQQRAKSSVLEETIAARALRIVTPLLPLFNDILSNVMNNTLLEHDQMADLVTPLYTGLLSMIGISPLRRAVSQYIKIELFITKNDLNTLNDESPHFAAFESVRDSVSQAKAQHSQWMVRVRTREEERDNRRAKLAVECADIRSSTGFAGVPYYGESDNQETAKETFEYDNEQDDGISRRTTALALHKSSRSLYNLPSVGANGQGNSPHSTPTVTTSERKSMFAFFSQSSSTEKDAFTYLDLTDLWSTDFSSTAPWKFRATIKHVLNAHSGYISAMDSHPNHSLFATCGRDELVKVWSLAIGTGQITALQTYRQHRAPLADVRFVVDSLQGNGDRIASVDGGLHLWDLETGQTILSSPFATVPHEARTQSISNTPIHFHQHLVGTAPQFIRGEQPQPITALDVVHNGELLCLGTALGTIRFLDTRAGSSFTSISGPWRILSPAQPISSIKCFCVGPTWICAGTASGELTVLDSRTGILRMQWRAHEGAVLKLLTLNENVVVSSGVDKIMCVWTLSTESEPVLCMRYTQLEEPIRHVVRHQNDLICSLPQGKLGITTIDATLLVQSNVSNSIKKAVLGKLQLTLIKSSKKSSSSISAMTICSPCKWLLMGSEDGKVSIVT